MSKRHSSKSNGCLPIVFVIAIVLYISSCSHFLSISTGSRTKTKPTGKTVTPAQDSEKPKKEEKQEEEVERLKLDAIEYPVVANFFQRYNEISKSPVEYVQESSRHPGLMNKHLNEKTYVGHSNNGTNIIATSSPNDEEYIIIYIEPHEGDDLFSSDMFRTFCDALLAIDQEATEDDAARIHQQAYEWNGDARIELKGSTNNAFFTFEDTLITVDTKDIDTGKISSYNLGFRYISIDNVPNPQLIGYVCEKDVIPVGDIFENQE